MLTIIKYKFHSIVYNLKWYTIIKFGVYCSESCSHKSFSNINNLSLTISFILGLTITLIHFWIIYSNEKCLSSFSNTGATTTLSSEQGILNSVWFTSNNEHIFLVANSNTAFLATFSFTCRGFHDCWMFITWNLFCASIFLRHSIFIISKLKTFGTCPRSAIMSVYTGILAHTSNCPCVGFWVKLVLNLMNVCIPRHFSLFY